MRLDTRISRILGAGLLLIVVTAGAAPGHARAQSPASAVQGLWYQAYDQGVRAATAGNWTLAIPALEAAKRGGPAPGRRVLFQGDRVDVFNPDYYLGLAYNATRRFAEAEAAFVRVSESGLVREGDREFEELRRQTARATYERTVLDAERAADAGQYADAEKTLQTVVGTVAGDTRAAKLVARMRELGAAALARETAAQPGGTPSNVGPSTPATTVTIAEPGPKVPDADLYKAPPERNVPTGPAAPMTKAPNPALNARVDPRPAPAAPMDETRTELEGTTAYLAGDYDGAIRLLRPIFNMDPPSSRVAFYLACAYVARGALAGGADQATLDEARRMFTYARGDSGLFATDRAFISPVVLRLLGSTATATAGRAATAS